MADWMPVTVVPRSLATVAIDTFMTELSRVMRNCPDMRIARTTPLPAAAPLAVDSAFGEFTRILCRTACRRVARLAQDWWSSGSRHDTLGFVTDSESARLRELVRLRRVRDRMDREYQQPLDVEALARGAGMSAGHLSRQFKLAYGESPYSYLMTRRIERAMALLRRGDLTVTDVCFAVGCSSLGTFSTRFTELVGMPPSQYQRQQSEASGELLACVSQQVTRPVRDRPPTRSVRNREAAAAMGQLA